MINTSDTLQLWWLLRLLQDDDIEEGHLEELSPRVAKAATESLPRIISHLVELYIF